MSCKSFITLWFWFFWHQNGESSNSTFKDPNFHTFHFCYLHRPLHFLCSLSSLHFPFWFIPSIPPHSKLILLLYSQPFFMFYFPFCGFSRRTKKKTIFLFCNFLISGFLVYWVSLIRRKNWWCGVSFGPYCVGSNGSDLILYWSSEGLICANFLGNVTRNEKCSCFLFWESI